MGRTDSKVDRSARRVRLVDIAKEVGVSRAVVGRVLLDSGSNIRVGPETAERIRRVARRLKYRPNQIARQLTGAGSHLIGILVDEGLNDAGQRRLWAAETEARGRGYRVIIGQLGRDDRETEDYLRHFDSHNVDAVLYLGTRQSVARRLSQLDRAISSVRLPDDPVYFVELDRVAAARMAVQHLLQRGRRKIGLIMPRRGSDLGEEKGRGYLEAMGAAGIPAEPELIWRIDRADPDMPARMGEAIDALITGNACDAIIATSDMFAVALIKALRRRGVRVPADVAVVGFGNLPIAEAVDPELTTIDHRHEICARQMIDLLVQLAETGATTHGRRGVMVPPELIARKST